MSSVIFSNAQRIISAIFQWLQTSEQTKTNNLITDTFSPGIDNATISGEGFLVIPGGNNAPSAPSISVTLGGIAYDAVGNRIFVSSSDTTIYNTANITLTTNDGLGNLLPTPQSTGVINIPVAYSQNYIWINYLATIDATAFTLNEITDAKIFYKQTDGYNIQVTTTNIPPNSNSIFLASVNMTGLSPAIVASGNISQVGRSYYQILPNIVPIITPLANLSDRTPQYNPASTYPLEAHIKAVGTGTGISPFNPHNTSLEDLGVSSLDLTVAHRQMEHGVNGSGPGSSTDVNNAIIAGVPGVFPASYPNTSAMACDIIIATSDYILVHQLLSTEFAIVNGSAYNTTNIFGAVPADAAVTFPNASGTYNVYWDSVAKVFGVTTGSIATDATKLWLCTVDYTYVGVLGHNALSNLVERRRIGSTTERYQRWVTTARPPNPIPGEYGFNLDINAPEYFDGLAWQSLGVLTGAVVDFAGTTVPNGYLICDGSSYSTTTYANLFAAIGYTWGGSGGNFNIPDFRRKVTVGSGGTGTAELGNTVGNTGGEETHTLTSAEIPPTSCTISISDPGHRHDTQCQGAGAGGSSVGVPNNVGATGKLTTFNTTGITASGTVNGGNGAHNNMQPSAIVTKIIKY